MLLNVTDIESDYHAQFRLERTLADTKFEFMLAIHSSEHFVVDCNNIIHFVLINCNINLLNSCTLCQTMAHCISDTG